MYSRMVTNENDEPGYENDEFGPESYDPDDDYEDYDPVGEYDGPDDDMEVDDRDNYLDQVYAYERHF